MAIGFREISTSNLKELERLQELIEERIGILKGKESLQNQKTYSTEETRDYLKKCVRK